MPMFLFSLISTGLAGCPFGFDKQAKTEPDAQKASLPDRELRRRLQGDDADFPSQIFTCSGDPVITTAELTFEEYELIAADVVEKYEATEDHEENNFNPRASFVGCIVRYSGHDFMDFRLGSGGGADGCVNFNDPDNVGLQQCISDAGMPDVYSNWCNRVSLADFIVIMGEAVMARTATSYDPEDYYGQGTLAKTFRDNFKFGRSTNVANCDVTGLMPNPEEGCKGLQEIFNENIFGESDEPWRLTAAISGAHTVGSAKVANSGYNGFWSTSDQQGVFNNDYYVSLLLKGWKPEIAVNGNADKNQWIRSDTGLVAGHKEIMLDTDMCLIYGVFEPENERFGASATDIVSLRQEGNGQQFPDEPETGMCCAWVAPGKIVRERLLLENGGKQMCGFTFGEQPTAGQMRDLCCDVARVNCNDPQEPKAPAKPFVYEFVKDEEVWLESYVEAWLIATENGHEDLRGLTGDVEEPVGPICEDDPDSLLKPKNPSAPLDIDFVCDDKIFRLIKAGATTIEDPCTYAVDFVDNKNKVFPAGSDALMSKKQLGTSESKTFKELCPKACKVCN